MPRWSEFPVVLKKLVLAHWRNVNTLTLEPGGGVTVFVGRNAQGKTNVVEAVAYLSCGRSHRTSHDRELVMWNQETAYLRAETEHRDGGHRVEMALNADGGKALRVGGLPARRMGELMGHVNTVLFAPEDLAIVKSGPAARRRFLDMDIAQTDPAYFYDLQQYQKALGQRNALLKQLAFRPSHADTLDVWDEQLATCGARIAVRRRQYVAELFEEAAAAHGALSRGERLEARLLSGVSADNTEEAAETLLRQLTEAREGDIRRTTTSVGPHRDDFTLLVNGYDLRLYGSQGQHRTAALALKLAELKVMSRRTGETPILILDDVLSELDGERRAGLIRAVAGVQTLLTCVKLEEEMTGLDLDIYDVAGGEVRRRAQ